MERKNKAFDLGVWKTEYSQIEIVSVKGRDIWDAYRKACDKFAYVRRPYCSKGNYSKKIKKQCNRLIRRLDVYEPVTNKANAYIYRRRGLVFFD